MGTDILENKDDILAFIYHTLQIQQQSSSRKPNVENTTKSLQDLLVFEDHVHNNTANDEEDVDSLKEVDQILISTALSLLLATLEANESIRVDNAPLLALISDRLDIFIDEFPAISPVAHECKLVLSARNATSSKIDDIISWSYKRQREIFNLSLKDIQDSQLPVRAHGLDQLRKLVQHTVSKNDVNANKDNTLDPSLISNILDVFIQAIKADDSYIYLNAVRGLVVMMDKIGHEILSQLSIKYSEYHESLTEIELDQRLRIGEAIIQVIKNLSDALPSYSHLILPQLIKVMSQNNLPSLLRASSLTILSQACITCILAVEPFINEILNGMEDLLMIESLQNSKDLSNPLDKDTNLVQLKRSALILIAMIFRSLYDTANITVPLALKSSLRTKINYIAQFDNDELVQHQATEVLEEFNWSNRLP
ncbi:hypothetical protein E3P92_02084 [Wallemia ichthyophaga]|uniref:RNA polymerase II assembly factor Rtp1 C-terminal domain-containing protein n=2 Tax=Wallemia ichthyophaga TaxID=245174 RepID=A0A4T0LCT0_WALIC|nr:Transmembrane and coiled-coil domain-containing protein 7 [Wallemia ichthyophaga EXF-994]TIA72261.1 hypothetical protein E3P91_02080 [Wallemia ichthyophaga]EOQ99999.1 Transmembrane and coiled-coil domain-containing protein 7 [Wallemia ichthyophaga EXF-994]TIA91002.1 hypothetical protein E3P97_02194 [Wallemia ichthyophaga]TIB00022.1 hypothetical protein E3P95_01820 [Wallemia ichthyophaga]TIB01297.1 hypothetical protein E3P94_01852 [Wallemia ichthyophaga]